LASGERLLGAQPIDAVLDARQPTGGLSFGLLARLSFLIFQPCLGDEQPAVRQRSHHIGQVVMGFALKDIADGERCFLWHGEPVGGRKLGADVAAG